MSNAMVQDNPNAHRYELAADGQVVAIAQYRLQGNRITFLHTEVSPDHEGKGYGSALARQALDDVGRRSMRVIPACEFIADFIRKNDKYADLVDPERE